MKKQLIGLSGRNKNKHVLSCFLLSGPGKTETDRPLANKMVLIKAAKNVIRPDSAMINAP